MTAATGQIGQTSASEDRLPKRWKPPDLVAKDLEKSGGVGCATHLSFLGSANDPDRLGLACTSHDREHQWPREGSRTVER